MGEDPENSAAKGRGTAVLILLHALAMPFPHTDQDTDGRQQAEVPGKALFPLTAD